MAEVIVLRTGTQDKVGKDQTGVLNATHYGPHSGWTDCPVENTRPL